MNNFFKFLIPQLLEYFNNNEAALAEFIPKVIEAKYDMLKDIDSKLNRLLYRENIQKKLLEQFYANMQFPIDKDVKTEKGLARFYENNNIYNNKIMD